MRSRLPELGPRGEGWVIAQLLLFAVIAATGLRDLVGRGSWNSWGPGASLAMGLGGLVAARAVWDLRPSLSPFPRPVAGAPLI
jgi:hypothetical protein